MSSMLTFLDTKERLDKELEKSLEVLFGKESPKIPEAYKVVIEWGCDQVPYKDYNELNIFHNGRLLDDHTDRIEPEDIYFYKREMSWIKPGLEQAYRLGLVDGRKRLLEEYHKILTEYRQALDQS